MKRIGRIGMIVGICIILAVLYIAFAAGAGYAPGGNVFSRVNQSLETGRDDYDSAPPPMPEEPAAGGEAFRSSTSNLAVRQSDGSTVTDMLSYAEEQQQQQPRLVIKNADLTIVVIDPVAKMQAISAMAESMGGFVVSSTVSESYLSDGTKVPEATVWVRVPQEKLTEALNKIKAEVVEVRNESTSGQDVTKEYTDLGSQLKNLEATEKKLTEIMDKATETEDVLAVFNQLTQIRGQIEVIKGQMKYYEQSAALSAVSVRLIADKAVQPIEIAGWQPQGEARDALQALVKFLQSSVNFLIWLAIFFLPVALLLIVLAAVLWRLVKWLWPKFFPKKAEATD